MSAWSDRACPFCYGSGVLVTSAATLDDGDWCQYCRGSGLFTGTRIVIDTRRKEPR